MKQVALTPEFFKPHVPEDIASRFDQEPESTTAQLTQQ